MTDNEKEIFKNELEKSLKDYKLHFEILRTRKERMYTKLVEIIVEEDTIDLLKIIKRKERLLKDCRCEIILNQVKYDFLSDEVQQMWFSILGVLTEKNYLDRIYREYGLD